jgi:dCTP deaminase
MSILSGPEIVRQREAGNIVIEPWDPSLVGPNSVDLHLGDTLLCYYGGSRRVTLGGRWDSPFEAIDSKSPPPLVELRTRYEDNSWLLVPGCLYLGHTAEWTETTGFVPCVDGRSTMGRLGLFCHVTAGRGDNGFRGRWTLELVVVEPLIVYAGQRIAQLTYHTIEGDQTFYGKTDNTSGRYQDSGTVSGPKV